MGSLLSIQKPLTNVNSAHLLTERPQVDLDRKCVAARFLVPLTFLKVKVEPQEGNGEEGRQLA